MKKIVLRILLLSLVTSQAHQLHAVDFEDVKAYGTYIAGGCAVVAAFIGYIAGSRSKARQLEHERIMAAERQKQEIEQRQENAQRLLYEIKRRNSAAFQILKEQGKVTKDSAEKEALHYAGKTPFIHATYAQEKYAECEALRSFHNDLSEHDKEKAKKIETKIRALLEAHNSYFQGALKKESEEMAKALAQQKILDHQVALKAEKYRAKKMRADFIQKVADESLHAIQQVSQESLKQLTTVQEQSNQMYVLNVAQYNNILKAILQALDENGLHALSRELHALRHEIDEVIRSNVHSREALQELSVRIAHMNQAMSTMKEKIQHMPQGDSARMLKKIEMLESALAAIAADIGDIKNNSIPQNNYEPSAPPRDF